MHSSFCIYCNDTIRMNLRWRQIRYYSIIFNALNCLIIFTQLIQYDNSRLCQCHNQFQDFIRVENYFQEPPLSRNTYKHLTLYEFKFGKHENIFACISLLGTEMVLAVEIFLRRKQESVYVGRGTWSVRYDHLKNTHLFLIRIILKPSIDK